MNNQVITVENFLGAIRPYNKFKFVDVDEIVEYNEIWTVVDFEESPSYNILKDYEVFTVDSVENDLLEIHIGKSINTVKIEIDRDTIDILAKIIEVKINNYCRQCGSDSLDALQVKYTHSIITKLQKVLKDLKGKQIEEDM